MNVEVFFNKNIKYIALILMFLLFIKTFQSCTRNMTIKRLNKEIIHIDDSLKTKHNIEKELLMLQLSKANDSIQNLNYRVKLGEDRVKGANRRADAVESTASKIKENITTTINIENKSKTDSVYIKNDSIKKL